MVAPLTPFHPDRTLNLDPVPDLAELLLSRGAQGFYLCGGTGEGLLLTTTERMDLVERWREVLPAEIPMIVQVGATSPMDAVALAKHAEKIRANGISSVTPLPYAAGNAVSLVTCFAEIAAAAPSLPFYYYHNSASPGLKIKGLDFLMEADGKIPNLGGIKFTDENLMDFNRCLRFAEGRYDILYGKDEMSLGALSMGARGFIGGSYNLLSPLLRQLLESWRDGRLEAARQAQDLLIDVIVVLGRWGGLGALKAALFDLGLDLGPMRLPLKTVAPEDRRQFLTELDATWPDWRIAA